MEKKPITSFIVGQPFPGAVPDREGAIMELWEIGLVVITQFPGLRQSELEAFDQGFKTYSYLESSTSVPIAVWVFDFPKAHGQIDATFNARFVEEALIEDYFRIIWIAIVVDKEDHILFIRHAYGNGDEWSLPGGRSLKCREPD